VLRLQQAVTNLHPANAEELANIARETGAEVLRGTLRYPSESGGWQLGDLDLSEHLDKYRDRDLVVIIASVGKAEVEQVVGGVCGFALNQVGECPLTSDWSSDAQDVGVWNTDVRFCSNWVRVWCVQDHVAFRVFLPLVARNTSAQ
jgi:hypothetical protein